MCDENDRSRGSVCAEKRVVDCAGAKIGLGLGAQERVLGYEHDRSRGSVCAEKHIVGCVGAKMNMVWAHMGSVWVMRTTEVAAVCALKRALLAVCVWEEN